MIGIIILPILAFILSLILVNIESLSKKNKQAEKYLDLLPGYNCGACGFGGCRGMSEAMVENVENYKKCKPLKGEKLEKMEAYLKK